MLADCVPNTQSRAASRLQRSRKFFSAAGQGESCDLLYTSIYAFTLAYMGLCGLLDAIYEAFGFTN